MGCEPIYGYGNVIIGSVHIRGGRKPKLPPCGLCGQRTSGTECDGPGTGLLPTCDMPLCGRCSIALRAWNKDFCPAHASVPPARPCEVGAGVRVPCQGVLVGPAGHQLCLHHLVLFDEWLGHHGGAELLKTMKDRQEERRRVFRDWLNARPPDEVQAMLTKRNVLPKESTP